MISLADVLYFIRNCDDPDQLDEIISEAEERDGILLDTEYYWDEEENDEDEDWEEYDDEEKFDDNDSEHDC